jgi:predicted metal-binding membrane protein
LSRLVHKLLRRMVPAGGGTVQAGSVARAAPVWWKRENLLSGLVLAMVTALAWGYTLRAAAMDGMPMDGAPGVEVVAGTAGGIHEGMAMPAGADAGGAADAAPALVRSADLLLFLFGWSVMMVAMMLPAAVPLILLYRTTARRRLERLAAAGMVALLAGYVLVWAAAGLPVYGYNQLSSAWGPAMAVLPGLLLIAGGAYQFTALKHGCHTRCSSPLFFLSHQWRPGVRGAVRLGVLHGIDCLGCCIGLMLALVALGMMNVAWMLTAAVIIFMEKTLPGGHRIARPLGVTLVLAGLFVLGAPLLGSRIGM